MKNKIEFNNKEKEIIRENYINGKSQRYISNILGVSQRLITRFIKETGIQKSGTTNSNIIRYKLKGYEELVKNICNDYKSLNLSTIDLAQKYQLHNCTIRKILNENNIDINSFLKRKYPFNEEYFNQIDSNNKAYIIGLLLADGNVGYNRNSICIDLQEKDKHILEDICKEINYPIEAIYIDNRNSKNSNQQNACYLKFSSKRMKNDLSKYGIVPRKSLILDYPDNIDHKYISHLIRGYFDGDGCFTFGNKYNNTSFIGTYQFINFIKDILLNEVGIKTYIAPHKNGKNTYVLSFSGKKKTLLFYEWLYKDAELYLYRKYQKFNEYLNINNNLLTA